MSWFLSDINSAAQVVTTKKHSTGTIQFLRVVPLAAGAPIELGSYSGWPVFLKGNVPVICSQTVSWLYRCKASIDMKLSLLNDKNTKMSNWIKECLVFDKKNKSLWATVCKERGALQLETANHEPVNPVACTTAKLKLQLHFIESW